MHAAHHLDIDLTPALWVLGLFCACLLALHIAERLAHTRARNRTRRAIETITSSQPEKLQKTTHTRASQ
jgi:hypothetical protein